MTLPRITAHTILTPRDHAILAAVAYGPLTCSQLRTVSQAFAVPFATEHRLRQRLRQLVGGGFLRRCPYATTGTGTLFYYLLTRDGFRVLFGRDMPLPPRSWFVPVSRSYETHTQLLGDVLAHTVACAHREHIAFGNYQRENALCLEVSGEILRPDAAFDLVTPGGRTFSFFIEADNRTEPLRSQTERNSLTRKVRQYEAWADHADRRFRVLFITRGGAARVQHFLRLAADLARNPDRSLFYGITTAAYLTMPSLRSAHFRNHRGEPVALIEERDQPGQRLQAQPAILAPVA